MMMFYSNSKGKVNIKYNNKGRIMHPNPNPKPEQEAPTDNAGSSE